MNYDNNVLEYLRRYHVNRGGDLTWFEIVSKFGLDLSSEALRRRIVTYEKGAYGVTAPENHNITIPPANVPECISESDNGLPLQDEVKRLHGLLRENGIDPNTGRASMYSESSSSIDDTEYWENWKADFAKKGVFASVMIWSDIHIPDESDEAISLAINILKAVKPNVLIISGDIFDFDAFARFSKHPGRNKQDAFQEVRDIWNGIVTSIVEASPDTIIVAIRGNHDKRADTWSAVGPVSSSVSELFANMVRSNGRVWWMGEKQETNIGAWYIQHGKKSGENVAKTALRDLGWNTPQSQGHSHQPSVWYHRSNSGRDVGHYDVVTSISVGALCNIPPHYIKDTNMSRWLHGIAVGHVDMKSDGVYIQNIVFHRHEEGALWAFYGNNLFTS